MSCSPYIYIRQGETVSLETEVTLAGNVVDLTGADIRMGFYDVYGRTLFELSTSAGQISVANNNVLVNMNAAYTQNLSIANVAQWWLRCSVSNNIYTLSQGYGCVVEGLPSWS